MSRNMKKKPKTVQKNHSDNSHQTIKPWHRIGAIVLVLALVVSMLAMYAF